VKPFVHTHADGQLAVSGVLVIEGAPNVMYRTVLTTVALAVSLSVIGLSDRPASAQMTAKAQVANLIAKVENGQP
jgi:carbonic anhydrase